MSKIPAVDGESWWRCHDWSLDLGFTTHSLVKFLDLVRDSSILTDL
jgi:hypothetical protein